MKTSPWHSTERKDRAYLHEETVHHDNTLCEVGENIRKKHLQVGTNQRPLCKECARLNKSDEVAAR